MKYSDVKTRHIYNVRFNPVSKCEFDGLHLAVVLKRNSDMRTCIVMPLTSESNGVGYNKVKLGTIQLLPSNLRSNDSYAVYNQIRTVNVDRFSVLKDDNRNPIDVPIGDDVYYELMKLGMDYLLIGDKFDEKIKILDEMRNQICINEIIDTAYGIKNNRDSILVLQEKIRSIGTGLSIEYSEGHKSDGIDVIIETALKGKIEVQETNIEEENIG